MKVLLQEDVKNLGKVGDIVNVKDGYARNFLFPQNKALTATAGRVKEWEHIKNLSEAKKKKADEARKGIIDKINGHSIIFKAHASETDVLFGSINSHHVSEALEKDGFSIDKKDIIMDDHIKVLGQHKAQIKLGTDLVAEIVISVERE